MRNSILFFGLVFISSFLNAQRYEFDYLLQWSTTTKFGTSNRLYFINSNNPNYRILIFDQPDGQLYAWLEDYADTDKHVRHVFNVVVTDPSSGKYRFIYGSTYKTGNYGHIKMGKLQLKKIDHNFYAISIYNTKGSQMPYASFEFYLEESDDLILFNNMENPKYLLFQPLIEAALPKDKKYTITRYITKNTYGTASDEKLISKQKIALTLEVTADQLRFKTKKN